jgi:hypothetical protein
MRDNRLLALLCLPKLNGMAAKSDGKVINIYILNSEQP